MHLYGGEISGNYAAASAGGICENDVFASGSPIVIGNTFGTNNAACDILLSYSDVITVEGAFEDGASLGVTRERVGIITSGFCENNPDTAVEDVFVKNNASNYLLESNGEVLLAATLIDTWEKLKQAVESTEISNDTNSEPNEIYVTGDISYSGNENINVAAGQDVEIILNGCTINSGSAGFYAEGTPAEGDTSVLYATLRFEKGSTSKNGTLIVNDVPAITLGSCSEVYCNDVDIIGEGTGDGALILYKDNSSLNKLWIYRGDVTSNSGNAISFGNSSGELSLSDSKITTNSEKIGDDAAAAAVYCKAGCTSQVVLYSDDEINALAGPGVYFESEDAVLTLRGGNITSRDNYGVCGSKPYAIKLMYGGLNVTGGKGDIFLRTGQVIDCSNYQSDYDKQYTYLGDVSVKTSIVMETPGIITKGYRDCFRKTGYWNRPNWIYTYYDPAEIFSVDDSYCVRELPETDENKYEAAMVAAPTTWSEVATMIGQGGTVKLTRDITADVSDESVDSDIIVTKLTTIDLNGHTINRNLNTEVNRNAETPKSGRVINASNNLTIIDTSEKGDGKITGGYLAADASEKDGAGIYLSAGTLTLKGGEITENRTEKGYGGGVYSAGTYNSSLKQTSGSTFIIIGGAVSKNYAYYGGGAAAYNKIDIRGGEIRENQAGSQGGGVYEYGSWSEMTGGKITKNKAGVADKYTGSGGGMYAARAFDFKDGEISENEAYVGGAVAIGLSSFTMSGGKMINNYASQKGGAVWLGGQTFHISGGEISGNRSATLGGAIYDEKNYWPKVLVSGTPKIINNVGNADSEEPVTDNITYGETTIELEGQLLEGAQIGIKPQYSPETFLFTKNYAKYNPNDDPSRFFICDKEGYLIGREETKTTETNAETGEETEVITLGEARFEKNYFKGTNVVLDSGINLLYTVVVNNVESAKQKYVTFSWGADGYTECDPAKKYKLTPTDNANTFTVECPIAAKEMADKITATLYIGDDAADTTEYSVKENLLSVISSNSGSSQTAKNTRALVQALLIYGNEAQKQFNYTSPSNESVYEEEYELQYPYETHTEFIVHFTQEGQMPNSEIENEIKAKYGVDFYGASLMLRNKTICVMYFEKKDAELVNNLTVTYNGEELTPKEENTEIISYEIAGINPQNLTDNFTVTMSDGTSSTEVPFNPGYYLGAGIYKSGTNEQLRNTLIALYNYSSAAYTYVNS